MKNYFNFTKMTLLLTFQFLILTITFQNCKRFEVKSLSQALTQTNSDVDTPSSEVKWHPGHYYTLMSYLTKSGSQNELNSAFNELERTPALRGMQIRFLWAEIETSKDVYDFSKIDAYLNKVALMGKRLVIQVQTKSFNPDWKLVPDYLKDPIYEGGVFQFQTYNENTIRGENIKLWNVNVRNRLVELMRVLGERYNSHKYFEAIGFIESAFGVPVEPVTKEEVNRFYDNMIFVNKKTRAFFPNTMSMQELNYPREYLKKITDELVNMGAGLSSPDIFLDELDLFISNQPNNPDGLYSYYPKLSGLIPLAPTIMQSNYEGTTKEASAREPAIDELLIFARDNLKANYIFWTRAPNYYPKVLEMLNSSEQTVNPEGGLNTNCPMSFTACVE